MGVTDAGVEQSLEVAATSVSLEASSGIPVIVVDPQRLVRSGIARLISDDTDFCIVGIGEGGPNTADLCASIPRGVVVMDIDLLRVDGIDMIREIRSSSPNTAVLVLATVADWRVIPAMKAGASGFLLKDIGPEALRSAVAAVYRGQQVVCREASQCLMGGPGDGHLTRQEEIVLQMVGQGARNREIAERLDIGEKTVRNYVSRLYRKLAVDDRATIASYARHACPVPPEREALALGGRPVSFEGVR